ncbi:hypothetical protein JXB37_05325, partial [candidate division WOR-3 bacterium]|nr:hypothetical protein [candidate division WOR-3 bacterium]
MRIIVCIALALPVLLLAAPTQPMTVLPDETTVPAEAPHTGFGPAGEAGSFVIGAVDTIGGTTYDWQWNGPAYRALANSPGNGVHAIFMYSASDQTTFPDRNMRYNYYDHGAGAWNWIDPDFMQSGVNVFTERCGFGNMDVDPVNGVAMVSAHLGSPIHPDVARDMAPGAGIFEYASSAGVADNYQWAYINVDRNSGVHAAMTTDADAYDLYYANVTTWPNWTTPVGMTSPQPGPEFPTQNVACSPVSDNVCVTWEFSAGAPDPGFYRISTDAGASWANPEDLGWPPAFGGDTATSYHITSIFPFYDKDDDLHIVANVMPYVAGTGYIIPAQLWHRCISTGPTWCHIHTATCDPANLLAAVGYNAMYACRPSLGEDQNGNLFIAWEQFDSSSVEPGPPERLRADIFYSYSQDDGMTWEPATKITDGGTVTHRFPAMLDNIEDTVMVSYLIDQYAGFYLYAEGPATNNPIVVQKWANPIAGGVAEGPKPEPLAVRADATPNPFRRSTSISYEVPRAAAVELAVYDIAGRPVRTLATGLTQPGRYHAAWDGRDAAGDAVAAGVYLYRYRLGKEEVSGKLL